MQRDHELLAAALDHFLEKGYVGTTVDATPNSLGMARRTVYARYGDKHGLFKAALQRAIDDRGVPLEQLRAVECADPELTLLGISRILVARMMSPAGLRLIRITNAESYRMPQIGVDIYGRASCRMPPTWRNSPASACGCFCSVFRRGLTAHDRTIEAAETAKRQARHESRCPAHMLLSALVEFIEATRIPLNTTRSHEAT